MGQTLLLFDVDQIQSYVFATNKLREIRGASGLIDTFNQVGMRDALRASGLSLDPAFPDGVYARGGQGMFLLATEEGVDEAVLAVQRHCRKAAPGLSVSAAHIALPEGFDPQATPYPDIGRRLGEALRGAKEARRGSLPVSLPILRPCDHCSDEPAMKLAQDGNETALLGPVCLAKRAAAAQRRHSPWHRLAPKLDAAIAAAKEPDSFEQIAEASEGRAMMALLYADGNGLGRRVVEQSTLAALGRFATAIDDALLEALAAALKAQGSILVRDGIRRFEPLIAGGDDLVLVLPASCAIDVAVALAEGFQAKTAAALGSGDRTTLSVGVVGAHASFPFHALVHLAKKTLDAAKKEGYVDRDDPARINFLVVTSPNHLSFEDFVERDLTTKTEFRGEPCDVRRTLRPYSVERLKVLREYADRVRGVPQSKIQQLRSAVVRGPAAAAVAYKTTLVHWPGGRSSPGCPVSLLQGLAGQGEVVDACWLRAEESGGLLRTPFIDLAELLDLVPKG